MKNVVSFYVFFCRNVVEEINLLPYCVFVEWSFITAKPCLHCERLEKGIEIDMYQEYPSYEVMPQSEKLDMLYRLHEKYPLFFQIYDWLIM